MNNSNTEKKPELQIPIRMDALERQAALCQETARAIRERLGAVLREETPSQEPGLKEIRPELVTLAGRLSDCCNNINSTTRILQSVLERLEL